MKGMGIKMTIILRVILIIACFTTCGYTLHKIRKSQMRIEDSIFWILFAVILVILSLFPKIAYQLAVLMGIGTPVNLVFLAMIFILLLKVFLMSIKISQLEYKMINLVQRIAIKDNEVDKMLRLSGRREQKNKILQLSGKIEENDKRKTN